MDAIRIQNLRSLADTGSVGIRPITLLLGRNSSGKSTFLRTFPLIRQSVESRTTGPILWYGSYVDFGSFADAHRSEATSDEISLSFRFSLLRTSRTQPYYSFAYYGLHPLVLEDVALNVCVTLAENEEALGTYARAVELQFAGQRISLEYTSKKDIRSFFVNSLNVLSLGGEYQHSPRGQFLPIPWPAISESPERGYFPPGFHNPKLAEAFWSSLRQLFHGNTNPDNVRKQLFQRGIGGNQAMLADLQKIRLGGKYWRDRAKRLSADNARFQRARDVAIANNVPALMQLADTAIATMASGVGYVAPLRATAERYYRIQDLAVDEVDFQGKNLPMFLQSLSEAERASFQAWVEKHFGLTITTHLAGGHISLHVTEERTGLDYNLADVGFGLSQVLPVIAQLWAVSHRRGRRPDEEHLGVRVPLILAIEQPELHLHPSMQARVADLLVDAVSAARSVKLDLRIVAETHSEAIVNRIGHRVYSGEIPADDVAVVLFDKEESNTTRVRITEFDSEGYLIDWPLGFFHAETLL